MAASLPDGATVHIVTGYAAEKSITAATNAAECVISVTAHDCIVGDEIEVTSGWGGLNGRVFRVTKADAGTLTLGHVNTTDTDNFPAGGGVGKMRKITKWTQITQILELTTSGGEPGTVDFSYLEENFTRRLVSASAAQSVEIGVADDPTLPGYQAAKKASDNREEVAMKVVLKRNGTIYYQGSIHVNDTPTLNKGNVMQTNMSYSLNGAPTRYL